MTTLNFALVAVPVGLIALGGFLAVKAYDIDISHAMQEGCSKLGREMGGWSNRRS